MGKISYKASPIEIFAPWTTFARMKATKKEQKRLRKKDKATQAIVDAQEKQRREDELRRQRIVQGLQEKVSTKLAQLEAEAERATQFVIKIRKASVDPVFEGVAMGGLEAALADIEKGVVTVQASTVVDAGSLDTQVLAQSYSDASSGLVAMRVITARVIGIQKKLEQEVKDRNVEQIRMDLAQAAAVEQQATAGREQRQFEEQRLYEREQDSLRASRRSRRDLTGRILEVDRELSRAKRRLGTLRVELANARFKAESLSGRGW